MNAASLRWRSQGAFALHAVSGSAIATRIPDLQLTLGLDAAALGLALTAASVGALSVFLVAARAIERAGTRAVTLAGLGAAALGPLAMALTPHSAGFFAGNVLLGAGMSLANTSMNVEADRIEASTGQRLMNRCHGIWALTFLIVSFLGAGLRAAGMTPALHITLTSVATLLALGLVVAPMVPQPPRPGVAGKRAGFAIPGRATLAIVGFGAGADLLHGAARGWSIVYLRDVFSTSRLIEGLALPAFVLTLTAARLAADSWLDRYSAGTVGRAHLWLALAGVALVALAPGPWWALAGFALVGAGVSVVYPMMVSAAARLTDRPAAENVAAMTLVVQVLTLGAPALVGGIAELSSLRLAFAAFAPLLVLGLVSARALDR